jgi:hypothetical protein
MKTTMNAILERYYAANDEKTAYDSTFMAQNPASPVSLFLLRSASITGWMLMSWKQLLSAFDESLHEYTVLHPYDRAHGKR